MGHVWNKINWSYFPYYLPSKDCFFDPHSIFICWCGIVQEDKAGWQVNMLQVFPRRLSLFSELVPPCLNPELQVFSGFSLRAWAHNFVHYFYSFEPVPSSKKKKKKKEKIGFTQLVILSFGCELGSSVPKDSSRRFWLVVLGVLQFVSYQVLLMCC